MKISGDTKIFEFVTDEIGTKEYFDKLSLNGDLDDKLKDHKLAKFLHLRKL